MNEIEEIKQRLSIVDLVGQYVTLQKSGRNYKGLCPFHSENTPSFMVSEELGLFKCFGCGKGGDIFKFLEEIEGIEFPEALEKLADKAGVELKNRQSGNDPLAGKKKIIYEINHLASEFYHYLLTKHPAGKDGLNYFVKTRGLTPETINEFKLGIAVNSWDLLYKFLLKKGYTPEQMLDAGVILNKTGGGGYIDKFRNRVIFPLIDTDNRVVGFAGRTMGDGVPKYLNTGETLVFHKGSFIYGLNLTKTNIKKDGAVFVEGYLDVITPYQNGYKNIVASSGTSLTISQLNLISRYSKDITFCFDSDSAGSAATLRALEMAEKEAFNIRIAVIPKDYKDIDEMCTKASSEVKELLKDALPGYDYYLISALKRNNKDDSIGKKKIMEELTPVYSRITNKVTLDHYIKKVTEELGIDEQLVSSLFNKAKSLNDFKIENNIKKEEKQSHYKLKQSVDSYALALLLKAPVDKTTGFMYGNDQISLDENYFTDPAIKSIFKAYKDFLSGTARKKDIKYFISSEKHLNEEEKSLVNELYLWDLNYTTEDPKALEAELLTVVTRLKSNYIKHKRIELARSIKQAESAKDDKLVKKLTREFESIV